MIAALGLALSLTIIDGDTFRLQAGETIRIENIDAPETGTKAKCDAERMLAQKATEALKAALGQGEPVIVRGRQDRYGRTLAYVRVNGQDVGELLIAQHVAVPWAGRRHSWCQTSGR